MTAPVVNMVPGAPAQRRIKSVGVVVVTYNNEHELPKLISSIRHHNNGLVARIVVVDNGSRDATVEKALDIGGLEVIENNDNIGFAAGVNVGLLALPDADAVAVLNPDLTLEPGALDALTVVLSDPTVGVALPRVVDADGCLSKTLRREPTLVTALGDAVLGSRLAGRPAALSDTVWPEEAYAHDVDVDWASGAAWLIARDCLDAVGPWKEDYFLYSEEVDYARRVRAAGLRCRYAAHAVARHVGGASGRSAALNALSAMNRVRYYRSSHSRFSAAIFGSVVLAHQVARGSRAPYGDVARLLLKRRSWRIPARQFIEEATTP